MTYLPTKRVLKTDVLCPEVTVTPIDSLSPGQQGNSAQILQEPAARHWNVVLEPLLPLRPVHSADTAVSWLGIWESL